MSVSSASSCVAQGHFPQVRFESGRRWLWNPARRQLLKIRPEERVRLQVMEWLQHECDIPMHRISTELPVKLQLKPAEARKRADILAYSSDFKPLLLVECKAEDVPLNEKASLQIAAYNEDIGAPYLLLVNGREERCFEIRPQNKIQPASCARFATSGSTELAGLRQSREYWQKRGFLGRPAAGLERLPEALNYLFGNPEHQQKYLQVGRPASYPELSHYYVISENWAVTVLAGPRGGSWLVALYDAPDDEKRMLCLELSQLSSLPPLWFGAGQEFSLQDEPGEALLEPLLQPDAHLLKRLIARLEDARRSTNLIN